MRVAGYSFEAGQQQQATGLSQLRQPQGLEADTTVCCVVKPRWLEGKVLYQKDLRWSLMYPRLASNSLL